MPSPFRTALPILAFLAQTAAAQTATTYEEQYKLIKAPTAVATLGPELFGDTVNLYNGRLEFGQTDVSLPGNFGVPVSVGRRIAAGDSSYEGRAFGRWELDIPHISGVVPHSTGWLSASGDGARCASFGVPGFVSGGGASNWSSSEYWQGAFLHVPGQGAQEMLLRAAGNITAPGAVGTYPVVTASFWTFSCLASVSGDTQPGSAGEGFIAISPDGTKYYFDHVARYKAKTLTKGEQEAASLAGAVANPPAPAASAAPSPGGQLPPGGGTEAPQSATTYTLQRDEIWLMPSKVVDRFGNTVNYNYDPAKPRNLTSITSSDSRTLTLAYVTDAYGNDQVSTVYDGTRTWTYSYHVRLVDGANMSNLDRVVLPDSSFWDFANFDPLLVPIKTLNNGGCQLPPALSSSAVSGSLGHPSGASGSFTLSPTIHGRSHVSEVCNIYSSSEALVTPRFFASMSLTNKTISGPGLASLGWNYDYGPTNESWDTCTSCISTKTVSVTDPASQVSRYTYGNHYNVNEGKLQLTETGWDGSSALRSVSQLYRALGAGPYPDPIGLSTVVSAGDNDLGARLTPLEQRVTIQQGVTMTWQASAFDSAFARPAQVVRSSSLGDSRSETTVYFDHLPKWVLGKVKSVTESNLGKLMVDNVYDLGTTTLTSVSHFGHLDYSMTYNADGTLATRKDGLNQTTTFTNYKRGIPQNIGYADLSAESAVVNNIGGIATLSNAAGYTTTFGYDAMGRLASITHPASDTVAWNVTNIATAKVAAAELDLTGGHWRVTVTTGNARTITYYDALLRAAYVYTDDVADTAGTSRIAKHQYDFAGRTIFESYPKRSYGQIADGVSTFYDALGRVSGTSSNSELGTLSTSSVYNGGFQKTYTDARGHSTTTSYQVFDEPSESAISAIAAPEGVSVAIVRDLFGKSKSITRSGAGKSATRSYVYDANERLCKTIEPETGATVQDYDAANNVQWRATGLSLPSTACDTASVAAAKKITFGYDTLNRLKTTTYADGSPAITRSYTADGLPNTIISNGSTWTNTYNKRRLNERESLVYGGSTYNIDRVYDANGSLAQLKYPDGVAISYNPNALGEARQVGSYASAITYHPNGAVAGFTYGNGIVHSLSQNTRGLPQQSTDGSVLNDLYNYDENANVAGIADQLAPSVSSRTMGYDNLDRLTTVSSPNLWGTATYGYDTLDNLTSTAISGGGTARTSVHTINSTTNRIDSISGGPAAYNFSYAYDTQGNIIQRGTQAYVFDQGNRMTSATGKATYGYDGLGHRFTVIGTDGVNRVQVYSQAGQLLYVRATSVALTAGTKYIYLNRHQIAEVKAAGAN